MKEIYKDIEGYKGRYQVSNLGNVKSLSREVVRSDGSKYFIKERVLKQSLARNGYLCITLDNKGKKSFRVHRLVAKSFIVNPKKLPQVNHLNGIKTDNKALNLEWTTKSKNQIHAYKLGLQKKEKLFDVEEAEKIRFLKDFYTYRDLEEFFNCSKTTLGDICNFRNAYKE